MDHFDVVVIGQGLAGAALAWALRWRGRRVLVVDREAPVTSSRVAAGLVTPITGGRLAKSWRVDELLPAAVAFYRRVEAETAGHFFTTRGAVRLFRDASEQAAFDRRAELFRGLVITDPPMDADWFAAPFGGFELPTAARLRVPAYLDASRDHFARDGGYRSGNVDPAADIEPTADGVRLPRFGVTAGAVVFCQGFIAADNPWFPAVRFNPAKGEILTLRVPGLDEARVVHRGVWLAPEGGEVFRAGATYDRERIDNEPTTGGRAEIEARLREFLRLPFDVIDHRAAVRPVVAGHRPVMGLHPKFPRLGYFNGLGSKGALVAPYFAGQFEEELPGGGRAAVP